MDPKGCRVLPRTGFQIGLVEAANAPPNAGASRAFLGLRTELWRVVERADRDERFEIRNGTKMEPSHSRAGFQIGLVEAANAPPNFGAGLVRFG